MSDDAGERRRRIQALREKVTGSKPTLKFRNYRPNDATIKEKLGAAGGTDVAGSAHKAGAEKGAERQRGNQEGDGEGTDVANDGKRRAPPETLIQQELKRQREAQDEEELNIAPKKVNWDLKRDVEKKLEKLNRRTQRAIVEIIRERLAEEAAQGSSSGSEEGGSSDGSESESGSSDDEGGGAGSDGDSSNSDEAD